MLYLVDNVGFVWTQLQVSVKVFSRNSLNGVFTAKTQRVIFSNLAAEQRCFGVTGFTAETAELNLPQDWNWVEHLAAKATVFMRNGEGFIAFGEVARLTANGPDRMARLKADWLRWVENCDVIDRVKAVGSGPIAFGTIAFSASSDIESTLVIPELVLFRSANRSWVTRILATSSETYEPAGSPGAVPTVENLISKMASSAQATKLSFSDGQQSADAFCAAVTSAVDEIKSGRLGKVVLARDIVAETPGSIDLNPTLVRLANRYPNCWTYQVDGMFGASPELLVRAHRGEVSARVLAGTAGRGTDPSIDSAISAALASSAKNLSEHAYAVESLVNALRPYCIELRADEKPFSLALPNLWHLASDVQGVLREDASALDIAAVLHPTAAVAGTPTETALELIDSLEPFDRGRYAGPVGWIDANGDGEWAIALRGAQLTERDGVSSVRAYAGCGIVAGSDPAAELAETELKFSPIRNAFA